MELIEIVRVFGLPGIIFVIWWFDHKRINQLQANLKSYKNLCEKYCKMAEDQMEIISLNITSLSKIQQKLEDYKLCPLAQKEKKDGA